MHGYPAWSYDEKSELREVMKRVCKDIYGKELTLLAVHGGLECGVFKALNPNMEIVTMGPLMEDIHTPQERLDMDSFIELTSFKDFPGKLISASENMIRSHMI